MSAEELDDYLRGLEEPKQSTLDELQLPSTAARSPIKRHGPSMARRAVVTHHADRDKPVPKRPGLRTALLIGGHSIVSPAAREYKPAAPP
jgi:hypothetical protein